MRICLVSTLYPSERGLGVYAHQLVRGYAKSPNIDHLTVVCDITEKNNTHNQGNVQIRRMWKPDSPLLAFSIIKGVIESHADIIHFNVSLTCFSRSSLTNFLGLSTILIAKLLRKNVLVTLHDIAETVDLEKANIKINIITFLGLWATMGIILKANKIVVTMKGIKDVLEKKYGAVNVHVIPSGPIINSGRMLNPGINSNGDGKTILSFGYWGTYKKPKELIYAFLELREQHPEIKLIIAGTSHPSTPHYLENLANAFNGTEGLEFTGFVAIERLRQLIESSTVIVLPYGTMVGSSGALRDARAYGKPIVASNIRGFHELLAEEGGGALFFEDRTTLISVLREIMRNKELQRRLSEQNLESAQKYSLANMVNQHIKLLESLAQVKDR